MTTENSASCTVDNISDQNFTFPNLDASTIQRIIHKTVLPSLSALLCDVLGAIDASIPNKDQNKAVRHIIRKSFDRVYSKILSESHPDSEFCFGQGYLVIPDDSYGTNVNMVSTHLAK